VSAVFDYAELATLASELLAEFGRDITLRSLNSGAYDYDTSLVATPAPTDVVRKAAVFDFQEGETEFNGNLIKMGDKRLLMEPGVVPTVANQVFIAGVGFEVLSVGEINPAGTPVVYSLHIRK